ncbi:YcgJ family protein, partial [Shigella flexneri]|nr:YcgJ family protein [Shigella flexneri]HCS3107967.1 YcgJ family protein [Shigella flexneri]
MNMMRIIYIGLSGVGMMFSSMASGHDAGGLQSPACGVVCDPYICVNSDGISPELTRKYLGEKAAENLQSFGFAPI